MVARINHDSSEYYKLRISGNYSPSYKPEYENTLHEDLIDSVLLANSRSIPLPDETIHLVVTSPPYGAGKEYDENLTLAEYIDLLTGVFGECYRVMVDGGRICVNIANIGRKPYIALTSELHRIMLAIGFIPRGQIIWDKGSSAGSSTSWGSWKSASNPVLRDKHEYILVYSKGTMKRNSFGRPSSISREDFMENTMSIWRFNTVSAKKIGHPAPFPVELPRRCIELYSFEGDMILDPFSGSGQTAIACIQTNRRYVMIDNNKEYVKLGTQRISKCI